jgi:hypothetical protein
MKRYNSLAVEMTAGQHPAQVLANDVLLNDGRKHCIARFYCWQGSPAERANEAKRLAWLFIGAMQPIEALSFVELVHLMWNTLKRR